MAELLPWLNLLLIPALAALIYVAVTLNELRVLLRAHNELDDVRFADMHRRLEMVERRGALEY